MELYQYSANKKVHIRSSKVKIDINKEMLSPCICQTSMYALQDTSLLSQIKLGYAEQLPSNEANGRLNPK